MTTYADLPVDKWEKIRATNNDFKTLEDKLGLELSELTLVSIFALVDPVRPGIKEEIAQCKLSGINVRMVTGDHLDTAIAISKQVGILTEKDLQSESLEEGDFTCMTGERFRRAVGGLESIEDPDSKKIKLTVTNKFAFRKIMKQLKILARSTPEDKHLLVVGLQDEGAVVAVTGDGSNDAPALCRADVGFAMGITGTEVAKNACHIVLIDDNFCSILTAVEYGRNIYDSVRKFL